MADKADAVPTPDRPASPAGGSKVLVGLMGLNSLLLVGVLAVLLLRMPHAAAARPAGEGEHGSAGAAAADGTAEATGAAPAHGEGSGGENRAASASAAPKPMLQLPDFVVHLRDPDADRYARLTLNVELRAEKDKETVNAHMPQLRDAFLAYLSDRTVEELRGSEGMALVKQDLAKKLNEIVPAAPVKALYVTEIVVQ